MTITAEAPAPTGVRAKLVAAAGKTSARKTTRRPVKRTPTSSRAATAAKKGKHADRIAPAIKLGAGFLAGRSPVRAAIIIRQADPFAAALDRVAAEDPRVDALLVRIGGWFGKGGAWGELGSVTLTTAGALMIAGGTVPAGPAGMVLAMLAGQLVQGAAHDAAAGIAAAELDATYGPDQWPDGVSVDPMRVAAIAAQLLTPPPAEPVPVDDEDQDQDAAPVRAGTFDAWSR